MSFFFVTFSENEKYYIILILKSFFICLYVLYYYIILINSKKLVSLDKYPNSLLIADIKNEYFCILKSSIFFEENKI